jgi:hypothetical protein
LSTNLELISLAVMTVNRPKNFVHRVVSSLPKDMPIRLIVGSPDYSYLARYRGNPRIEIIGADVNEWEQIKNYQTAHRTAWNYWRCFVYGAQPHAERGLLILEDDVIPAQGWEKRLRKTLDQIESQFGDQFILSLYTAYTELPTPVHNQYYTRYPADRFFGNQAMYYPESVRVTYAEYLKKEGVEAYRTNPDLLLSLYLKQTGIPLFCTTPCLFQHIGAKGTGQWGGKNWRLHTAGNFAKVLPDA